MTRAEVEEAGLRGAGQKSEDGTGFKVLDKFYMAVDENDHGLTPHIKNDGFWESWITSWIIKELGKEPTWFYDVGANMGYYSLLAASMGCPVMAFEPQEHLIEIINKSIEMPQNSSLWYIFPVCAAVGESSGVTELVVPKNHSMNASVSYKPYSPSGEYETTKVTVLALDEFARPHRGNSTSRNLVKIDVEGAEDLVWAGMQKMLSNQDMVTTVLMEFNWNRSKNPAELATKLFEYGTVSYVDYNGDEQHISDPMKLKSRQGEDWMLVLRPLPF